MNKLEKFLTDWNKLTKLLEYSLIDNLASSIPWLAPILPSYISFHNMITILGFPLWVSGAGAIVIEFLGIATVATSVQFWDWNRSKRVSDPHAPFMVALVSAGAYLFIILVINVVLDTSPMIHKLAKALLSILSIIAAVLLSIRGQHSRRILAIQADKDQKRQERLEKRQFEQDNGDLSATYRQSIGNLPDRGDWRTLTPTERENLKGLSTNQIIEIFPGISPRTAREWKRRIDSNA